MVTTSKARESPDWKKQAFPVPCLPKQQRSALCPGWMLGLGCRVSCWVLTQKEQIPNCCRKLSNCLGVRQAKERSWGQQKNPSQKAKAESALLGVHSSLNKPRAGKGLTFQRALCPTQMSPSQPCHCRWQLLSVPGMKQCPLGISPPGSHLYREFTVNGAVAQCCTEYHYHC